MFAVVFAIPGIAYRAADLNAIFAFWFAYILTRPVGASFADWAGKSQHAGGLGYGDGPVSFLLAVMIVALVGYVTVTQTDDRPGTPTQLNRLEVSIEDERAG